MRFIYTNHAKENMIERKISSSDVESTINNPNEELTSKKGRKIAQKIFGNRLLRVIYKEAEKVYIIVTVYFTKIRRYKNEN